MAWGLVSKSHASDSDTPTGRRVTAQSVRFSDGVAATGSDSLRAASF